MLPFGRGDSGRREFAAANLRVGSSGGKSVVAKNHSQSAEPVASTEQVLLAEYRYLWGDSGEAPTDEAGYNAKALANGQAALCLSGGGIRSAAFALGVLQALSRKELLTRFHYLSTVSGGGYIGSWLQRWIHDEKGGAGEVMRRLAKRTEPEEVKNLRENSNFITPRVGLGSNDTWTAIAISSRNIVINWLLFAPLLMLVALVPNLFAAAVAAMPPAGDALTLAYQLLGAACLMVSTYCMIRAMPSYRSRKPVDSGSGDGWLLGQIVAPLVAWSIFGTLVIGKGFANPADQGPWHFVLFVILSLVAMGAGLAAALLTRGRGYRRALWSDVEAWLLTLAVATIMIASGPSLFGYLVPPATEPGWAAALVAVFAPLWLLGSQLVAIITFIALRTPPSAVEEAEAVRADKAPSTVKPDADREWLARVSAIKMKPMLLWAVAGISVLMLGALIDKWLAGYDLSFSGLLALATGGLAVSGGKSSKSGDTKPGIGSTLVKYLPLKAIIAVATFLFAVAIFMFMGRVEGKIVAAYSSLAAPVDAAELLPPDLAPIAEGIDSTIGGHLVVAFVLILLLVFFGRRVEVNRFSLNGLYRNRLTRAFLGGARPSREPDPFTGFDPVDNVRMHTLLKQDGDRILYPIVNVALNVTASEKLAWQERKAEPFIFSPLYSGSAMLAPEGGPPGRRTGAYIDSSRYGGSEADYAMEGSGVSLATAMSISGAAASPNMGYNSSPATAFLMTLFNVRLGAWLPNPACAPSMGDRIKRSGPSNSLRAVLRELGGATDDRGWDIYLSDGGHFENLGLYEMIRRRCRYIVVSDAGADPGCAYSDLGGAVRKAKIDLNVDIRFDQLRISSRDKPLEGLPPQRAWALGEISYPEGGTGRILYLKPSYFGQDLPVDVVSYAAASKTFPHESTGDQFFSESQFESYRRLGYFFIGSLGKGDVPHDDLAQFFAAVERQARGEDEPAGSGGEAPVSDPA
jgi:hypothetical protein